jgi:hypothetical protein
LWEPLAQVTAAWAGWTLFGSLATYLVHAFIGGRIISRGQHEERVGDYRATIAALEATVRELKDQQRILLSRDREPIS